MANFNPKSCVNKKCFNTFDPILIKILYQKRYNR